MAEFFFFCLWGPRILAVKNTSLLSDVKPGWNASCIFGTPLHSGQPNYVGLLPTKPPSHPSLPREMRHRRGTWLYVYPLGTLETLPYPEGPWLRMGHFCKQKAQKVQYHSTQGYKTARPTRACPACHAITQQAYGFKGNHSRALKNEERRSPI